MLFPIIKCCMVVWYVMMESTVRKISDSLVFGWLIWNSMIYLFEGEAYIVQRVDIISEEPVIFFCFTPMIICLALIWVTTYFCNRDGFFRILKKTITILTADRSMVNERITYRYYQIAMRLSIGFDPIMLKQEMKAGI